MRARTVVMPTRVLKQWDAIAAAQLCRRATELDAENEALQRSLRWAEQLTDHGDSHSSACDEVGPEGIALQVLA